MQDPIRRAYSGLVGLLCVVLIFTGSLARAEDGWDLIGPSRIGASLAEISQVLQLDCNASDGGRQCVVRAMPVFAGVPVTRVDLRFEAEQLAKVSVVLSDQYYKPLFTFLTARLGNGEDRSFKFRGGMGAVEFVAGVYLWEHDRVSLVLEQFAGRVDRSALTYGTKSALTDLVQSKRAYPPGSRRDL